MAVTASSFPINRKGRKQSSMSSWGWLSRKGSVWADLLSWWTRLCYMLPPESLLVEGGWSHHDLRLVKTDSLKPNKDLSFCSIKGTLPIAWIIRGSVSRQEWRSLLDRLCVCVCAHTCALNCSVMSNSLRHKTVACQAPLSMGFSRQEYWSRLTFPSSGDLLDPGIKPKSPAAAALQVNSLPLSHQGSIGQLCFNWKKS